jgi:hypothetical protein
VRLGPSWASIANGGAPDGNRTRLGRSTTDSPHQMRTGALTRGRGTAPPHRLLCSCQRASCACCSSLTVAPFALTTTEAGCSRHARHSSRTGDTRVPCGPDSRVRTWSAGIALATPVRPLWTIRIHQSHYGPMEAPFRIKTPETKKPPAVSRGWLLSDQPLVDLQERSPPTQVVAPPTTTAIKKARLRGAHRTAAEIHARIASFGRRDGGREQELDMGGRALHDFDDLDSKQLGVVCQEPI